jgi:hypothetical protein
MEVPEDARPFMTLPAVRRKFVCSSLCIDGQMISGDVFLTPRLRVLPMGWSWALWFCQSVHEHIGRSVGHADSDQASDKTIPHPLSTHDTRHGKYVDNFLSMSHDPSSSAIGASSLRTALENSGLSCHEEEESALHTTFAGLDFDGQRNAVRVSLRRSWRLRIALVFLSQSITTLRGAVGGTPWAFHMVSTC